MQMVCDEAAVKTDTEDAADADVLSKGIITQRRNRIQSLNKCFDTLLHNVYLSVGLSECIEPMN